MGPMGLGVRFSFALERDDDVPAFAIASEILGPGIDI
jgi:hypothetical protein